MRKTILPILITSFIFTFTCFSKEPAFGGRTIGKLSSETISRELEGWGSVQGRVTICLLTTVKNALVMYIGDWGPPKGELHDILGALIGRPDGKLNPARTGNPGYMHFDALFTKDGRFKAIFFDSEGRLLDGWGTPFVMRRDPETNAITIISCGPNGVLNQASAENANSDDIYVTIPPKRE